MNDSSINTALLTERGTFFRDALKFKSHTQLDTTSRQRRIRAAEEGRIEHAVNAGQIGVIEQVIRARIERHLITFLVPPAPTAEAECPAQIEIERGVEWVRAGIAAQ